VHLRLIVLVLPESGHCQRHHILLAITDRFVWNSETCGPLNGNGELDVLKNFIFPAAILLATTGVSFAHHHDRIVIAQAHQGHGAPAAPSPAKSSDATKAFEAANAKMHKDMTIKYSGNVEADFVRGMIPHHQGAIDMAKVALQYGKNPEIRKLAEEIIKAQEGEIAWMRDWLKKNGH
jgi:predicted outer membrane protein